MGAREVDAIRLKVKRAEEHLAYFKDIIRGRVGPIKTPNTAGLYYDDQRKTIQFHADATTPPPEWSIVVGDVIHQLRTCLDHLIFALATRPGRPPVKNPRVLGFPLAKDAENFNTDKRVSKGILLHHIGIDELAEVKLSQPYKRKPSNPTGDLLYVLSKLDDIDKHRAILILSNQLAVSALLPKGFTYSREETEPGTERFRLDWDSSVKPDEVQMEHISLRVSFREPGVYATESNVARVIEVMIEEINSVLQRFDRFF